MAGRTKVYNFHPVRLPDRIHKHNILWLQVGMDQTHGLQLLQCGSDLLKNGPYHLQRQRAEFVLLEEIIQVLLKHLEHKAGMVTVLEALESPHQVMLVRVLSAQTSQDADLNLALPRVGRVIFQDLYRHHLAGASFPAFDHLTKGTTAKEVQHLIGILH